MYPRRFLQNFPLSISIWQNFFSMCFFRSFFLRVSVAALILTGIGGVQNLRAGKEPIVVDVADAVTYVKLAKVNLSVGTMTVVNGKLVGTYSIDVPLMKSKYEKGRIILPLSKDLEDLVRKGGSVTGKGVAEEGSQSGDRKIDARFGSYDSETKGGRILLTIDTGKRILEFDSTYHLSGKGLLVLK